MVAEVSAVTWTIISVLVGAAGFLFGSGFVKERWVRWRLRRRMQVSGLTAEPFAWLHANSRPIYYTLGIAFRFRMECHGEQPDSWTDVHPEVAFLWPTEARRDTTLVWQAPDKCAEADDTPRQIGAHGNLVWESKCIFRHYALSLPQQAVFRVRCEFLDSKPRTVGLVPVTFGPERDLPSAHSYTVFTNALRRTF